MRVIRQQRKKTLLKEYEDKDRAGGIVDRRFGENDPTMSLEERMLERFTRERQRASKGVAFNLEDEDELTHYGQSLSKLDDFDNVGLGLDEDEGAFGGAALGHVPRPYRPGPDVLTPPACARRRRYRRPRGAAAAGAVWATRAKLRDPQAPWD